MRPPPPSWKMHKKIAYFFNPSCTRKSLFEQNTSSCFVYGNKIRAVCSHWEPKFCWINLSAESIVIKLLENESGLHCFKKWQNVLRDRGAADKRRHICGLPGTSNLKHHCTAETWWWWHWMLGRAFMIIWETFTTLELVSLCVFHKRFSAQNYFSVGLFLQLCTTGDLCNVVVGLVVLLLFLFQYLVCSFLQLCRTEDLMAT